MRYATRSLARKAGKIGAELGFSPAFVAVLVTYLSTNGASLLAFSLDSIRMWIALLFWSFFCASIILFLIAAAVFVGYKVHIIDLS
jgi:hypothetical protein